MPYSFGNWSWYWTVGPTNHYFGYPTAAPTGDFFDTTKPSRCAAIYTAADFQKIAYHADGSRRFTYVIINLEPYAFGADPSTAEVPNSNPGDNNENGDGYKVHQMWQALADDIAEARAKKLGVMLAMHASFSTPKSATDQADSVTLPGQGQANPSFLDQGRVFPGPYRVDLFTTGLEGNPHPIDDNHPLPTFWRSFVGELRKWVNLDNDISFRVGGESLVGLQEKDYFEFSSGRDAPFIYGGTWPQTQGPAQTNMFNFWKAIAVRNYWDIERRAIKAIWNTYPDARQCRIVCQPGSPWPYEFAKPQSWQTLGSEPAGSFTYKPYLPIDLSSIGISAGNAIDWSNRLMYAPHIYDPFGYTHAVSHTSNPLARRYYRQVNGPVSGDDSWNGGWPLGDEVSTSWLPDYLYKDYVLKGLSNPLAHPTTNPLSDWRTQWGNPPMVVTEFGVQDRWRKTSYTPGGNMHYSEMTGSGGAPPNPHDNDRGRWHYDVRAWLTSNGIGWGAWDMFGEMAVFWGDYGKRDQNGNWDYVNTRYQNQIPQPPVFGGRYYDADHPEFIPYMWQGLFGETRP